MSDFGEFDTVPDMQKLHQMRGTVDTTNSHIANAPTTLTRDSHLGPSAISKPATHDKEKVCVFHEIHICFNTFIQIETL